MTHRPPSGDLFHCDLGMIHPDAVKPPTLTELRVKRQRFGGMLSPDDAKLLTKLEKKTRKRSSPKSKAVSFLDEFLTPNLC